MTTNKINGIVNFKMELTQGLDVSETKYETNGILYVKPDNQFLFFEEETFEEETSSTKCRVEFSESQIRIRREGPVTMDQIFKLGQTVEGYIKTIYGQLNTEAKTHRMSIETNHSRTKIVLDYDLYVSNERTGNYKLTIGFSKEEV